MGLVTFVATKVTKNAFVSANAFFAAQALALQTGQNLVRKSFDSRTFPPHQNLLSPCSRTWPTLFCLISPEAGLLTGVHLMLLPF